MSTIQTGSLPLFPPSELILADQIASLRRQVEQVRSEMITADMRMQYITRLFLSTAAPISQINPLTDPAPLPTFAMSSMSASSSSASGSLSTENHESVIDPDPLSIFDIDSIPTFETSSMLASSSSASGSLSTENHESVFDIDSIPTFETSSMLASSSSASEPIFKAKSMSAGKYPCSVCDKGYANRSSLNRHMRTHGNSPRPYHCVDCTKCFGDQYGLDRHLLIHTGKKPHKCTEKSCDGAFADRGNLTKHINAVHRGIKDRQCSICSRSFATNNTLRVHIKNIHRQKGLSR